MASAATNNSPRHVSESPRHVTENRGSPTATQSRRPSRQVSSPWTQIVRGESEPPTIPAAAAAPSKPPIEPIASASVAPPAPPLLTAEDKSEDSGDQGNAGKKPVWNRPSNGASEIGPVMGASSWPALSEATKAPSNKPSFDSSLGDVPSSSVSQGAAASASVPAPKQVGRVNNPNPTQNNSRQRSFKRNGASANGTAPQPSAQGSLVEGTSHNPSPRGQSQKNGFAASQTQTHGGTADNQRDSHRNQNGNHHHHQNHGGRRSNQEHGNQNWNFNRSFNGRDGNAQSQRGAPAFVRYAPPPPPPPPVQAIPPQFMAAQSFGSFPPELAPPFYPGMPFVGPLSPGPVFYHVQDLPLNTKLQHQIHYYFSEENLIKDTYLREQMDDQGFAPLYVIAGFRKVAELTDSIQQIVDALQGSPYVEVQGDRIRKRHNWQHWLIPKDTNPAVPSPQAVDAVASRVGNLSIGQGSAEPIGGSGSQLQPAESENKAVSDGQPESSGVDRVSNSNGSGGAIS